MLLAPIQDAKIIQNAHLESIAAEGKGIVFVVIVVKGKFVKPMMIVALQENAAFKINVQHLAVAAAQMPIANLVNTVAVRTQAVLVTLVVLEDRASLTVIVVDQGRIARIQTVIAFSVITAKNALNYRSLNVLTKAVVILTKTAMYLVAVITAVAENIRYLEKAATQIASRNIATKTVIAVVPVNAATLVMNALNVPTIFPHG